MESGSPAASTLIQLTDSHLFADAESSLLGIASAASLSAVVDQVQVEQPQVAAVLGTGDIAQDGSAAAYAYFARQMARIPAPMRWIAGNHDHGPTLVAAGNGQNWQEPVLDVPGWRVVLLDSSVPGKVYGFLSEHTLRLLERLLQDAGERQVLLCLHHHPVPVGSAWMDRIGLRNADELFAILARYPAVHAVLSGHVHQEQDVLRDGVRYLTSPSTCVQFLPNSNDFVLDVRAPGYRWLRLYADGTLETGVSRVAEGLFVADQNQAGY